MWYLIRHPQTELNLQKKYHGWEYAPYTDLGIKQFQAITQYALNLQADFVYSSDLRRCELLARRIAQELQLPLTITTALLCLAR